MTTLRKVASVAALSAALFTASAGLAQAGTFNSISDIQPSADRAASALTAHRVIDTVQTVSGEKIVYSDEEVAVHAIGPRNVSERVLAAETYGVSAPQS